MTETVLKEATGEIRKHWGWLMFFGIVFVIMGMLGLGMSTLLTLTSVLFFGVMILVAGGLQLVDAFKAHGWKSILAYVLIALLYIAAGIMIIVDPLAASAWLTLAIASILIAVGILRIIMGFQMNPARGWGWPVFSGVISILLGIMIISRWPVSGLWVIGLFVAIELIMQGWAMITISLVAKNADPDEIKKLLEVK
jgi:uncharacterized membrane protein HdeD (DUF308 family)